MNNVTSVVLRSVMSSKSNYDNVVFKVLCLHLNKSHVLSSQVTIIRYYSNSFMIKDFSK